MNAYVLDTNFIVRYLLADEKEQYQQASVMFLKIKKNEAKGLLVGEVLAETVFVLSSVYGIPKEIIVDKLIDLIVFYQGMQVEKYLLSALVLFKQVNLHIVDCMLVEKAKAMNLKILSFDQKLLKLMK